MVNTNSNNKTLSLESLKTPTLLIDPEKCKWNIRQMKHRADMSGVIFRPHFKTHQSAQIGEWFRDEGVQNITVSSIGMASYFAGYRWDDITVAIPVNVREIDEINRLASAITLNILLESVESAAYIAANVVHELGYFIETDTGYHRTGVDPGNDILIREIIRACNRNPRLRFKGFLAHAGESYQSQSRQDILRIYRDGTSDLQDLFNHYKNDFPGIIISWGDTPTCSQVEKFENIHEIRPGNFVFYDVMQFFLGSCRIEDIAVVLACPVIAKYPSRKQLVIYGGAVHFSKDFIIRDGKMIFGLLANPVEHSWERPAKDTRITSLSQEHGVITSDDEGFLERVQTGDILLVYPIHSCLVADINRQFYMLNGDRIECMERNRRY